MYKKLLAAAAIISGLSFTAQAQDFALTANPVDSTTTGCAVKTPDMEGYPYIELKNHIHNPTAAPISVTWNIVSIVQPSDWLLVGICDNTSCFGDAATLAGGSHVTTVGAGADGLMDERVYAPTTASNGISTVKVKLSTLNTTDTAIFILRKTPLGVSTIKLNDNRVSVYPNPATNSLIVFANKDLSPAKISITNITGQTVSTSNISKGTETTDLDISALSKGSYMVHIINDKGQLVTARKFVKK